MAPRRHNLPLAEDLQDDPRPADLDLGFSSTSFPEIRLAPLEFQELIDARGVGCLYRKALRCPCARVETRQPRAGCPSCGGLGYLYPEVLEEPIVALVLNRASRRTQHTVGQEVTGTVTITFPLGIIPSEGDMILPDHEEHAIQQLLFRSVAQVDNRVVRERQTAPDQRAPAVVAATDRLLYPDVKTIEAVYWLDEESRVPRFGREGRDFTRKRNEITWRADSGPAPGRAFSVRYRAPAAYMISPGEPVFRTGEEGFPYRCEGQRLDKRGTPDLR